MLMGNSFVVIQMVMMLYMLVMCSLGRMMVLVPGRLDQEDTLGWYS